LTRSDRGGVDQLCLDGSSRGPYLDAIWAGEPGGTLTKLGQRLQPTTHAETEADDLDLAAGLAAMKIDAPVRGVEIGSNCAVDRATLTSTYIRSGTKLDNICHIAHNCDLGENGFFTAGFMMGGSTKIGRQFVTGGNSVVTAHITLGDNVILAGRSSVTCDVPDAGSYGGYPLQPLKEAMKTIANIGHLNEIRKNLNRVMRHLHLLDKASADSPDA